MSGVSPFLHIAMDSYFASVEIRENTLLRGLPVIIGADPKGGHGRGVVSTCSYEARKYGIYSGMPISKAYNLCPKAHFLPVNLSLYYGTSERIMAIIKKWGTHFHQVSIDEACLQLDACSEIGDIQVIAERIQKEIAEKEHLTCSIGIGPTRMVAKIASDHHKPNGITIIPQDTVEQFLFPLPVGKIPGIGKKKEAILVARGISTIGELATRSISELTEAFGKSGFYLHSLVHGVDICLPHSPSTSRSLGREITFDVDTLNTGTLHAAMIGLVNEVHDSLNTEGLGFQTISVKVRYTGCITRSKSKSLSHPSNDRDIIKKVAISLFRKVEDGRRIRLIGLRLSRLSGNIKEQRSLAEFLYPTPLCFL